MVTFTEDEVIEIVSAKTTLDARLRLEKLTIKKVLEIPKTNAAWKQLPETERAELERLYSKEDSLDDERVYKEQRGTFDESEVITKSKD